MGANFQVVDYDGDEKKAKEAWRLEVQECLHEFGYNEYGGHLGLKGEELNLINTKETAFASYFEAEEYICDINDKWEDNTAVWYWHGGKLRIMVGGWCPE